MAAEFKSKIHHLAGTDTPPYPGLGHSRPIPGPVMAPPPPPSSSSPPFVPGLPYRPNAIITNPPPYHAVKSQEGVAPPPPPEGGESLSMGDIPLPPKKAELVGGEGASVNLHGNKTPHEVDLKTKVTREPTPPPPSPPPPPQDKVVVDTPSVENGEDSESQGTSNSTVDPVEITPTETKGPGAMPASAKGLQTVPTETKGPQTASTQTKGPQAAPTHTDGPGPKSIPTQSKGPTKDVNVKQGRGRGRIFMCGSGLIVGGGCSSPLINTWVILS